jgi:hypothetical protein
MNQHWNFAASGAPETEVAATARGAVHPSQSNDLIWGAQAIADELGRNVRAVYHLAITGALPIRKKGGRLVASRAQLRAAIVGEAS